MKINKIYILIILNIVTYLLAFLIFPILDLYGLMFLLLNVIFVPTFFCAYAKRLAESSETSRKRKTVVILSSASAMIAADILACIIKFKGIMVYYIPAKGVLYLICAIWALLNYHLDRPSGNKKTAKILTVTFATVSLMLNAFLFFPFAPWYELIQYEVLLILPFLFAFMSISSYLIGKMASYSHTIATLIVWGVAILASVISLCLCFFDLLGWIDVIVLGIPVAGIIFVFSIIDVLKKRRRSDGASFSL
jgi:hypothetical protein